MGPWTRSGFGSPPARQDPHPFDQAGELRQRLDVHLVHHPGAVDLDRLQRRAELVGGLLVEPSGDDAVEDLALARRQAREPLPADDQVGVLTAKDAVGLDRLGDAREELLAVDRLAEEVARAAAHRADDRRRVAAAGQEDDRQRHPGLDEAPLHLEAVDVGHRKIEDHAAGGGRVAHAQELLGRVVRLGRPAGRAQQPLQAPQHRRIVVDDEDRRLFLDHLSSP